MTTLTHSLLSDLRAKAEAANECAHTGWHDEIDIYGSLSVTFGAYHGISQDASCIAAASPSVVLALLDRIKAQSEGMEALKTGGSAYHMLAIENASLLDDLRKSDKQHAALCGEIETLEAEVATLRAALAEHPTTNVVPVAWLEKHRALMRQEHPLPQGIPTTPGWTMDEMMDAWGDDK